MDPEGPARHAPRQCSSLTLADLGDTVGFRDPADLHKTYGFKIDDKGYYSRAEIPLWRPADDEWDIHLEVRRTVAYLEHNHMLVRLENLGIWLISYQACKVVTRSSSQNPEVNYKSFLKVINAKGFIYGMQATETKPRTRFCMKSITEFTTDLELLVKPPAGSTIYLELVLDAVAQTKSVSVLPGVSIKWATAAKARHTALVLTSGVDGKWISRATAQDVIVSVGAVGVNELIFGSSFVFIRLLFSFDPVSDSRIDHLISQLKN
jgi:hypothetical protein